MKSQLITVIADLSAGKRRLRRCLSAARQWQTAPRSPVLTILNTRLTVDTVSQSKFTEGAKEKPIQQLFNLHFVCVCTVHIYQNYKSENPQGPKAGQRAIHLKLFHSLVTCCGRLCHLPISATDRLHVPTGSELKRNLDFLMGLACEDYDVTRLWGFLGSVVTYGLCMWPVTD